MGTCPWVRQEASAADNAQAKRMEQIITQLATWRSVLEKLETRSDFMSAESKRMMNAALAETKKVETELPQVKLTLSVVMLVTILVKAENKTGQEKDAMGADLAACEKYVTKILKVQSSDLPPELCSKMRGAAKSFHSNQSTACSGQAQKPLKKLKKA